MQKEDNSILKVTSDKLENVNVIAYFLVNETSGVVFDDLNNLIPLEKLKSNMDDFNLEDRIISAQRSIWRKSSEANQYPNLEHEKFNQ